MGKCRQPRSLAVIICSQCLILLQTVLIAMGSGFIANSHNSTNNNNSNNKTYQCLKTVVLVIRVIVINIVIVIVIAIKNY